MAINHRTPFAIRYTPLFKKLPDPFESRSLISIQSIDNLLENCVLCCLCNAELHNRASRDLDRFTCCWVAAHALLAMNLYELSDARNDEFAALLDLHVCKLCHRFKDRYDVLLAVTRLFSEGLHDLGLCQFCHIFMGKMG